MANPINLNNRNTSVWTNFDWVWYGSNMENEVKKAQSRVPNISEYRRMWKRTRTEMYALHEEQQGNTKSRKSIPRMSLFESPK
jgi:hypothetical protein